MKEVSCYARGGFQYFWTLFSFACLLFTIGVVDSETSSSLADFIAVSLAITVMSIFSAYMILMCLFYQVTILDDKIIYVNCLRRQKVFSIKDIYDLSTCGGRGLVIELGKKGKKRITIYSFYKNYGDVCKNIVEGIKSCPVDLSVKKRFM